MEQFGEVFLLFVLDPRRLEYTPVSGVAHTLIGLFQPPRLLYGRAANYGSFIVLCRGNDVQFSRSAFQHRASPRLGYCPLR